MLYWSKIALFSASLLLVASCATSSSDDQPCTGDTDCPGGQICDPVDRQCVDRGVVIANNGANNGVNNGANSGTNNGVNNGANNGANNGVNNGVNNGDADMGMPEDTGTPDMGGAEDMAPSTCTPACSATEVCDRGQCVSACMPECVAPQVCTATGCEYPDCTQAGDPCEATRPDQNGFACLSVAGEGVCFDTCSKANEASDCSVGSYCYAAGTRNVCLPTECDTDTDCAGDTCIRFDNDYGACFSAGPNAVGAMCNPSATNLSTQGCNQGAFCKADSATTGSCAHVCDPFAANPGCQTGQACAWWLTPRTGLCVDRDNLGTRAFDPCNDFGDACDDGIECLDNGGSGVCFQYCRHDANDCAGLSLSGTPTVCNPYVFPTSGTFGLCLPPCAVNNDCPVGFECRSSICREPCMADGDCCGGAANCPYSCNANNLCE